MVVGEHHRPEFQAVIRIEGRKRPCGPMLGSSSCSIQPVRASKIADGWGRRNYYDMLQLFFMTIPLLQILLLILLLILVHRIVRAVGRAVVPPVGGAFNVGVAPEELERVLRGRKWGGGV